MSIQIIQKEFKAAQETDQKSTSLTEVESSRAVQEAQGAMILAKKFPRDVVYARDHMLAACKRQRLAEDALYEYPKGGQKVTGPSIRLAEMAAQNWGNLDFGIRELETKQGQSVMQAYCWDLQTNVRQTKTFTVLHQMDTKDGPKKLTSQRDIYENNANLGARRLRACILGIIPGDLIDDLVQECEETLKNNPLPLAKRIPAMLEAFSKLGVSKAAIEKFIGANISSVTEFQIIKLQKIYGSIKDGFASASDFFEVSSGKAQSSTEGLLLGEKQKEAAAKKPGDFGDDVS